MNQHLVSKIWDVLQSACINRSCLSFVFVAMYSIFVSSVYKAPVVPFNNALNIFVQLFQFYQSPQEEYCFPWTYLLYLRLIYPLFRFSRLISLLN